MEAILKRTAQRVHESDDEKLLIEQAQNGDREAFEQLVRRHDRDILRLAFHMLGNREEAREVFQETLAATTYYSNPERRLYGKEVGEKIREALKTLSEKERLVFELRHYQGLRLKMIGEIMGSTEETAKNYLFRATQKLRAYLTHV